MVAFRASTLVLALVVLFTASACVGSSSTSSPTGSTSSPTGSTSSEAAPAGRFAQCLSIRNYSNARDSSEMRAHAQALRALDLDDDLREPVDAMAQAYDDLADSIDDLADSTTNADSYVEASDRYNDAHDDVGFACRQ